MGDRAHYLSRPTISLYPQDPPHYLSPPSSALLAVSGRRGLVTSRPTGALFHFLLPCGIDGRWALCLRRPTTSQTVRLSRSPSSPSSALLLERWRLYFAGPPFAD